MKEKEEKKMEITIVREENQSYFEPLMPRELWEKSDLVLGAIEEGAACGVLAATEESEHIMALEYLFVAEDYRRKGIATALLDGLHEIGRYSGMDLTICQYALNEEQSDLDLCLDKNLFELDEVRTPVYRTAFGDLSPQYFGKKPERNDVKKSLLPLSEVTARMWNRFAEKLEKLPEDEEKLTELEVKYMYDQDASFLLVKKGEPTGCILFEQLEDDFLLSYFCVLKDASPVDMMHLFQASYQNLKTRCSDTSWIYINALTETTEKMVKSMTDQKAVFRGQAVTRYYYY